MIYFRELGSAPLLAVSHMISHMTSLSAGPVPDFRSGMKTVLETGPGSWELRAKGQQRDSQRHKVTTTLKAVPTSTHMALVRLQKVRE